MSKTDEKKDAKEKKGDSKTEEVTIKADNVILMTKIFDSWNKMAFQVIKARVLEKKNNKLVFYSGSPNDSIVLPIGTELKIQNEEKFLRDTTTYTANTVESGVTYNFNIDSITNYMCMKIENRKYTNKCY